MSRLPGHSDAVQGVDLSGDGRLAVSASSEKTLKVSDVEGGRELRTLSGHRHSVSAVAMTPDGQRAISGSWQKLKLWDLTDGRELRTPGE
jgi:WD40 repeat protein